MRSQWRCFPLPCPHLRLPHFFFFLLITNITILCNFKWCENGRMLWMLWSHRVNDDGKMVPLSLDYNKVMQTLTLWPDAALPLSMSTTLGLDWPVSIPSPGRCNAEEPLVWGPLVAQPLAPPLLRLQRRESLIWPQAARFAPSACCSPCFWVMCAVTSFTLYFRGTPISSKYLFAVLKNISLYHRIAFQVSDWVSKWHFPAAAML